MNDRMLDILTVLSFIIGLENLDENINQSDIQKLAQNILSEIHGHLEEQDRKLDIIIGGVYANNKETIKND